jgi:hypothetical protein
MHSDTRKQAITDGGLVDVSEVASEAGIESTVALTRAVWASCVQVPPCVEEQDEEGRVWNILWMLNLAIQECFDNRDELVFELLVQNEPNTRGTPVALRIVRRPSDAGDDCLTITLLGED